jgi:hypothetical protein
MTSTSPTFVLSLGEHRLCTWPAIPHKKELIVYNERNEVEEWEKIRKRKEGQHRVMSYSNNTTRNIITTPSIKSRMQLQFVLAVTGKSLFGRIELMFPSDQS